MSRSSITRRPDGRRRSGAVAAAVATAAVLLAGSAPPAAAGERAAPAAETAAPDLPLTFGGPFELVDHTGAVRTDRDFLGRFVLVYFGYTSCPDVCPLDLAAMAEALDQLGGAADRVQPLFVTVDPARDTAGDLAAFVGHFHPRLLGLTGSEAQVRAVAKAYRVHRRKVPLAAAAAGDDGADYVVDHGSIAFLMGPDGGFLTLFPHGTDPGFMSGTIRRYLRQADAAAGRD